MVKFFFNKERQIRDYDDVLRKFKADNDLYFDHSRYFLEELHLLKGLLFFDTVNMNNFSSRFVKFEME
jgi:hypothetical protein